MTFAIRNLGTGEVTPLSVRSGPLYEGGCCGIPFEAMRRDEPMQFGVLAQGIATGDDLFDAIARERPIDLAERTLRPFNGCVRFDDVNEQDVCGAFSRDIYAMLQATLALHDRGMELSERNRHGLPAVAAVYWLNCPLDDNFSRWRLVYVGKAADLNHRWNNAKHHRLDQAIRHRCRLNWWEVAPGTETIIEAALVYELKPAWNERQ